MTRRKAPNYYEYLASAKWRQLRLVVLRKAKFRCAGCVREARHVHHLTYVRLGRERLTDLVALCPDCHRDVHLYHVEHPAKLAKATHQFLQERRELFGVPDPAPSAPSPIIQQVRSVACPKCLVNVGTPCRSAKGNPRAANHQRRVVAYHAQKTRQS